MNARTPELDVVTVGHAIVDVLAHCDDALVAAHGLVKGTMTLVDLERSAAVYDSMPAGVEVSGGSAADTAHRAGRRVALTLSDPSWVALQRDAFTALLPMVDILLGNETEALEITGEATLDAALATLTKTSPVVAVTRGAQGAAASDGTDTVSVPAEPVAHVDDTTGAGDLFAAGFLLGLARERPLGDCLRLGGLAAAEVISHTGARPQTSLAALAAAKGLAI